MAEAAPSPVTAGPTAAPGSELQRLRRLLALGAVVLGALGAAFDGQLGTALVVAAVAGCLAASTTLTRRAEDLRPWLILDGTVGGLGVLLTGGATSPLLLAVLAPLLIAGMVRSVGTTGVLLLVTVPAVVLGAAAQHSLSIVTVLVATAIVGSSAETVVARRRHADVLATADLERERLLRLNELLDAVDEHLGRRDVPLTTRALLLQVRRWSRLFDEPDLLAIRAVGVGGQGTWQLLGADDELRPLRQTALPVALLATGGFAPVTTCDEVTRGEGVDGLSRRAAYLWLTEDGAPSELLALEWAEPGAFSELEVRLLERLRVLLEQLRSTQDRLERLREHSERAERSRLAARLHDDLAQELLYVRMELDRAVARHPDDAGLTELADVLRGAVTRVRTTIGELRIDARRPASTRLADQLEALLGLHLQGQPEVLERQPPHVRDVLVTSLERAVGSLREQGATDLVLATGEGVRGLIELRSVRARFDPKSLATSGLDLQLGAVGLALSVTVGPDGSATGLRFGAVEDGHPGGAGGRSPAAARELAS